MIYLSLLPKIMLRDFDGLIAAGNRYRDLNKWRSAAVAYGNALKVDPQPADIWMQLGHAYKESGQLPLAKDAYSKALEARPDDADFNLQLGHFHKVCGDVDRAGECYLKALTINPYLHSAYDELQQVGWSESQIIKACPAVKGRRRRKNKDRPLKRKDAEVFTSSLLRSLSVGRQVDTRFGRYY